MTLILENYELLVNNFEQNCKWPFFEGFFKAKNWAFIIRKNKHWFPWYILGQGCSMEQMSGIRDQQESLAKLHFELGARQDPSAPLSEEGTKNSINYSQKYIYVYRDKKH
jgi:hypothetical protein